MLGPGVALVIENEGAHVQGLVGLVERLVGRKQNSGAAPVVEGSGQGIPEIATSAPDFKIHLLVIRCAWHFGKMERSQRFATGIGSCLTFHTIWSAVVL